MNTGKLYRVINSNGGFVEGSIVRFVHNNKNSGGYYELMFGAFTGKNTRYVQGNRRVRGDFVLIPDHEGTIGFIPNRNVEPLPKEVSDDTV